MKSIIISVLSLMSSMTIYGQDPIEWNFSVKKITDKIYKIHLVPTVKSPWHIYSQTSSEKGAFPTKISFNKNPLVIVEGKAKEIGKVVSKFEDVFGVTVKYFEGAVDFVQMVKLKKNVKTNLTGSIEFMACNNKQCLPPTTVKFNIKLE